MLELLRSAQVGVQAYVHTLIYTQGNQPSLAMVCVFLSGTLLNIQLQAPEEENCDWHLLKALL